MSWSKSAAGSAAHVIEAAEAWAQQVYDVDKTWAGEAITNAHRAGVEKAVEAVKDFAGHLPEGYHMSVSANGHSDGKSLGTYNVSMGAYLPVPIAA